MPEHIRAYILLVVLSWSAFIILSRWSPLPKDNDKIKLWSLYWIAATSVAFLSHNYWVFALLIGFFLIFIADKKKENHLIIYFLLLPALPVLENEIPGFGGMRVLLPISWPRLLVLCVLLSIMFSSDKHAAPDKEKAYFPTDKYLFSFVGLSAILAFRDSGVTDAFRASVLLMIDIFIPYYVISRNLKTVTQFRYVFYAIACSAFVLSIAGGIETFKGWHLYDSLNRAIDLPGQLFAYEWREGFLRASTTMAPIPFGYFLVIGIGTLVFFKPYYSSFRFYSILAVMLIGLLSSFSRAGWMGFALFLVIISFYDRQQAKALGRLAAGAIVGIFLIGLLPGGERFFSVLPFIGDTDLATGTVDYRTQLFDNSILVIQRNLLFGSSDYLATDELVAMRQGQGIIDIVNTYLQIGLSKGLVGLSLFIGIFASLLLGIRKAMLRSGSMEPDYRRLGQVLLGVLVVILFIIATVSSVHQIPNYYWAIIGLSAAYVNMMNTHISGHSSHVDES